MNKQFYICGMTCVNCKNRIENSLKMLDGVKEINVDYRTGAAQIKFDSEKVSFTNIEQTIKSLGYEVQMKEQINKYNYARTISFLVIIIVLYVMLQEFGILNQLIPSQLADSSMGYGMLFLVGLLTSVHCIAMCGGINLSQCLPVEKTEADGKKGTAFLPAIYYNLGRVVSYTAVGFLLGFIGWLFGGNSNTGIPLMLQGILKMIAGLLMVVMGINMLGIFPWLRGINIRMPKFLLQKLGQKKPTVLRPFGVGLLNGLMPCGPLQSMQILALATANPFDGALSMFCFSLGTVPLMLGLGSFVSALGQRFTRVVMQVGAVLVTVLGLAMFSQGSSLSGFFSSEMWIWQEEGQENLSDEIQIEDGTQLVESTLSAGAYPEIRVQKGIPVKWTIYAPEGSINGCNYKMVIQEYDIEYTLKEGENIIEFLPEESGTFSYTCWMGMIKGAIIVTENSSDDLSGSDVADETVDNTPESSNDIQTIGEGEYLEIVMSDITETASFYSILVDGTEMEVLAIKASDGTIRTAFNTCQMCYPSGNGYYVQDGKDLVCQNCGSRFTADQVENLTGGCNPWPIFEEDKTIEEDRIYISYDVLKELCEAFTYRKR